MANRNVHSLYSATAWLLQHLSYTLCRWYFFRLKGCAVTASLQLEQVRKPVILAAAPHLSHTDVILIPTSIPHHLLPVRWLADKKIFNSRFKALWFKLWGAVPVERDSIGTIKREDIQWILDFATQGQCIGVFPECCLVGGRFGDPHRDLVVAALQRNICVLPVGLTGNARSEQSILLKGVEQKIRVKIGVPLSDGTGLLDAVTL